MINGRVGNARLRNQRNNQARIFNKFPQTG